MKAEKVEKELEKLGLREATVITFTLPTEYKGSLKEVKRERNTIIETRVLKNANKFRTLRKLFYTYLSRIAFNTPLGWLSYTKPAQKDLEKLSDVVKRLEKLSGEHRIVTTYTVFIPKDTYRKLITDKIQEVKYDIEKVEQRLREKELKEAQKRRLAQKLRELKKTLKKLEEELAYL